ncbi:hypothetical protein CMO89_01370 [Candidatus Woesearchaeota archaeon]|nr:hypothetical protein [Candidatus Woesearchaeota archaeon]
MTIEDHLGNQKVYRRHRPNHFKSSKSPKLSKYSGISKGYKKHIGKAAILLPAIALTILAGRGIVKAASINAHKPLTGIERTLERKNNYINLNLDGTNYIFLKSENYGPIDTVVVEWTGTKNTKYEKRSTKFDTGNLYFLNLDRKACYNKVPVVGGIYDEQGNPTSPHNTKMIGGGFVENPYYALKDIPGGAPNNPFGDALVKLYNISDEYTVEDILGFIVQGTLNFPERHDSRQLHGKAPELSNLGYTVGCIRIDNTHITALGEHKEPIMVMYFKN